MRKAWVSWQMFVHDMATGGRLNEVVTVALIFGSVAVGWIAGHVLGFKLPPIWR